MYGPEGKEEAHKRHMKELADFEDMQFKILDFLKETLGDMYPDLWMKLDMDDPDLLDELQEKRHWPIEELLMKVWTEFGIQQHLDIDWGAVRDLDDLAYEIVQATR
jgi:hypothetical protein